MFRTLVVRALAATCLAGLVTGGSCQPSDDALLLPADTQTLPRTSGMTLLARFVHITDTHMVDVESPARWTGSDALVSSAWRPWEAWSTQLLDGIVRTTNRIHASGTPVDFAIITGDVCDNLQLNELDWFATVMDGGTVHPLSGADDRPVESRPDRLLDPYATFKAAGVYRQGVHGEQPSIPWYSLMGNHDAYSIGVFPVVAGFDGHLVGVLPLAQRPGLWLPNVLDPLGELTHGRVTPADPGPPGLFELPVEVPVVAERAYFDPGQFISVMNHTRSGPRGHGFDSTAGPLWYSVSPVPGLRLCGLYTSQQPNPIPEIPNHDGCILADQLAWLRGELEAATSRGERVVVASHHPSGSLLASYGSAADADSFQALLNAYPCVILHLAGHNHRNRVADRGHYLEIETCSTLDWPQEARLLEIWRDPQGEIFIGYDTFSHLDERWPPLGEDPLRDLREQAWRLALAEADTPMRMVIDGNETTLPPWQRTGTPDDRRGFTQVPSADLSATD